MLCGLYVSDRFVIVTESYEISIVVFRLVTPPCSIVGNYNHLIITLKMEGSTFLFIAMLSIL